MNPARLTDEQLQKAIRDEAEDRLALDMLCDYNGFDKVVDVSEVQRLIEAQPIVSSIKTKLPTLNQVLDGFREGELVIVSGPTGHGKTQLLTSFTYDFAENDINCLWLSYEVGQEDLINRFNKVPSFSLPLEVVPSSTQWLERKIMEARAKFNTKVVFIDHLHYLISMDYLAKSRSTSLAIGQVLRELKAMAIKTKTTIFLVSHLTKVNLDGEPTVNDLRDSSFTGQEADSVIFIFRDTGPDKEATGNGATIKISKNRRRGTLSKIGVRLINGRFIENG